MFQAADTGSQAQQLVQGAAAFGKRPAQAEALGPVLQQVGELAFGQPQAGIQRHPGDLLALAGAVDGAAEGQGAEDGAVGAVVQVGELAVGLTVGGWGGVADIAVAVGGDMGGEQGEAQLQQALEEAALDLVDAQAGARRGLDEGDEVGQLRLGLEEGLFLAS